MDLDAGRGRSWSSTIAVVAAALFLGIAVVLVMAAQTGEGERPLADRTGAFPPPAAASEPVPAEISTTVTSDAVGVPASDSAQTDALGAAPAGVPSAAGLVTADATWTARTAAAAGIPERALRAYASAALTLAAEQPGCGLGWNTLAGIGAIESAHGTHSGGQLDAAGYPQPPIRGIPLDGTASAAIGDTDGGVWDGDAAWDRAVGPLQFIPSTWARWGADGNGDGVADPNQIDDAALAAGRYLCAAGEMSSAAGWRRAIFSYNHLDSYVDDVAAAANAYAARAGG